MRWKQRRSVAVLLAVAATLGVTVLLNAEPTSFIRQQPAKSAAVAAVRVDRGELMRVVRTLSGPAFEGRRTGTPGGLAARRFIRDAFQQIGLSPAVRNFIQPFSFVFTQGGGGRRPQMHTSYDDAANVLAVEPGTLAGARTIVVSAHYDHLGRREGVTYPGADDNASGIAVLLAVARHVHAHPLAHRVVFAAFDAEELGLEGAKAFVKAPPVPMSEIALDINFDMLSRNARHEIYAAGTFQNPSLEPIIRDVQQRSSATILFGHDRPRTRGGLVDDWTMQSDHGVFDAAGVPFLYFGVEDHPDYHKPTDTADRIDPKFFGDVAEMIVDFVVTADRVIQP